MRTPVLACVAVLAACATPPAPAARAQLGGPPRERSAAEPRPQEPRHIDQLEPRERPFRGVLLNAHAAAGFGHVAARVSDSSFRDRADARFLRFGLDSVGGVGLHVEVWDSEAELFPGQVINDGDAVARAEASLSGVDAFPHWHVDVLGSGPDRLTVPLRLGVFVDRQELRHERAGVDRDWGAIGPRGVAEPTWRLLGDADGALDLVGRVGVDGGVAWFRERFRGGSDRDATWRVAGELGLALRGRLGRWQAELGCRAHHALLGSIDTELFGAHDRVVLQREQVFVGVAVTW